MGTALRLARQRRESKAGTAPFRPEDRRKRRMMNYAPIMACTDCGFGTAAGANNLTRDLVFKKIGAMCKGAKLLEEELAAEEAEKKDGEPLADLPSPIAGA